MSPPALPHRGKLARHRVLENGPQGNPRWPELPDFGQQPQTGDNAMNPDTLEALQGSIAKWEAIVAGTGADRGGVNCPLCLHFGEDCSHPDDIDDICPVAIAAKNTGCENTPYEAWSTHQKKDHNSHYPTTTKCPTCITLAQAELDFLRSLLPDNGDSTQVTSTQPHKETTP